MDPLLKPYKLKNLEIKNRLMTSAHEPSYAENGLPMERYRKYHVERAKGGLGLTMTAGSAIVSPDSPSTFGNLHAYKDEIVPCLKKLSDECHDYGSKVMIQITHLGRRTNWNHSDWLPILSASSVREPSHRAFPKEAEDWDIERILNDYVLAAERMKEAKIDGIEIEAYGHFLDSFWSPATNKRNDEYGGSLDNRTKFSLKVIDAIRKSVGDQFILGVRMVADEDWDKGLTKEEGLKIANKLIASKQVDFLNIIRGHIDTDAALTKVIPTLGMSSAPHLDFAGEIKFNTKFPIFHASKINDVSTARHAVESGKLDMVGMTRAHIADPHIINKIMSGNEDTIRPCVGATYCLDRIYEGNEALCIHNPATGREKFMPHEISVQAKKKKKIVIVGAGPSGLEAAKICAERGHNVVVFEANQSAGGQLNLITRSKRRRDMMGIIDWRIQACYKKKVKFYFNTFATKKTILDESPDAVIIATGGIPNTDILESGNNLAITTWDIISGSINVEDDVILYDDNGAYPGLQAAETIISKGAKLEIITPERFFAPDVGGLNHVEYTRKFIEHEVIITINKRIKKIEKDGNRLSAVIGSDYSNKIEKKKTSQIVIEHGTIPNSDLYFELKYESKNLGAIDYKSLIKGKLNEKVTNKEGNFFLYRVGDAISSRNIHASIYDSLRICKNL